MLSYIFISSDCLGLFAGDRYLQSADYAQSKQLVSILTEKSREWHHNQIFLCKNIDRGIIFHSQKIDKKKGVLFDLSSFAGFRDCTAAAAITIFQKVIKYAIKYYTGMPLLQGERYIGDRKLTLVYPFPFAAQKEVEKVYIDLNSSNQNRAEQDFLTVFYYGHNEQIKPSFTNLNKVVEDLKKGSFQVLDNLKKEQLDSLSVTNLDKKPREFTIDARIGLETWKKFLTKPQLDFVKRDVVGAERLEGAAGSGKTIAMVLRCVNLLTKETAEELHIIFITHSLASKETIIESFRANCQDADTYIQTNEKRPNRSILITTLLEWSSDNLGTNSIEETEFVDKDAADSKLYQSMFIQQAIDNVKSKYWHGYSQICSSELVRFMEIASSDAMIELFRYEISVLIKGRSNGIFDKYDNLQRPQLCLPLKTTEDRRFAFAVFAEYQNALEALGQFDSDDITLSALGQINTPIWKRRSIREGYDVCFVDETQLFNFNELSVFHYMNKPEKSSHIIYAIDRTQSFGEVGFTDSELSLLLDNSESKGVKLETIFRSSPEIIDLAFNILASNSAIFVNFENPLDKCSYSFTVDEEVKCESPIYYLYNTDDDMIQNTIAIAEQYHCAKNIDRGNILIVATTQELFKKVRVEAQQQSKPIVTLRGKNDIQSRQSALNRHSFVLSEIDFVGGLEFDAVIIVGVDKGRVPPEMGNHFTAYAWHNRMYVAVTRSKYSVKMLGNRNAGESPVLESALYEKKLKRIDE